MYLQAYLLASDFEAAKSCLKKVQKFGECSQEEQTEKQLRAGR